MSGQKDERAEEIIIVRRRHEEGDHHHGGVWKIAFADFMTALMAFFLVMWLINAANTETKASVASYFNPVKLTDSVSRRKGLLDLDEKSNALDEARKSFPGQSETKGKNEKTNDSAAKKAKDKARQLADGARMGGLENAAEQGKNSVVSEIARAPAIKREQAEANSGAAHEAGRVFRDPFAPFTSPRQVAASDASGQGGKAPPERDREGGSDKAGTRAVGARDADGKPAAAASETRATEASELLQKVRAEIQRLGIVGGPGVEVTVELDNIVFSLTDTATFGMFAVGSAEPNEPMVRLMQGLTPIISSHGEQIVVRGHTDARPFRGEGRNNNWRLAMARAEAAYAMLLRSGIDETRFERIEAHADRKLKVASDPQAAANRRIEVLLRRSNR